MCCFPRPGISSCRPIYTTTTWSISRSCSSRNWRTSRVRWWCRTAGWTGTCRTSGRSGPDIAVFHDMEDYQDWATLDVGAEGMTPDLVVEVTSPGTRQNDLESKFDYYNRGTRAAVRDRQRAQDDKHERRLSLMAFRWTRGGYQRIAPDHRGWIWLEPVRLWLGVAQGPRPGFERVACFNERGEEIGDYTAVTRALVAEAEARAQAEARAEVEASRRPPKPRAPPRPKRERRSSRRAGHRGRGATPGRSASGGGGVARGHRSRGRAPGRKRERRSRRRAGHRGRGATPGRSASGGRVVAHGPPKPKAQLQAEARAEVEASRTGHRSRGATPGRSADPRARSDDPAAQRGTMRAEGPVAADPKAVWDRPHDVRIVQQIRGLH